MKEEKCYSQKRVLLYRLYVFLFSVLLCGLLIVQNASALTPSNYQVHFNIRGYNNDAYFWGPEIQANETFYAQNINRFQWKINSIAFTGNNAVVHFETNIVIPDVGSNYSFISNLNNLIIGYCGTGGVNGRIRSQSVSTARTVWYSNNNTVENITLTIYGDAVATGLQYNSGNHDFYCAVSTSNDKPFLGSYGVTPHFYIEQSPTTITFTNDETEALMRSQINSINNVNNSVREGSENIVNAIENQSENEKQEYEEQSNEVQNDLEDGSSEASSQGQTLIQLLVNFYTSIRDVQPSSGCNVYFDLRRYSGGTRELVNLCSNGAKSFLTLSSTVGNSGSGLGFSRSIWTILSTAIFSILVLSLVFPTINLMKRTYEELRK